MKQGIIKRVQDLPKDILKRAMSDLQMYGIAFYDNNGKFNNDLFKQECKRGIELILINEKPHPETNIRYQLCGLMAAIQTIVGVRNIGYFLSE